MRKILQGIKNLIVWFPIIWNDFDWDYNSVLIILQFKLKRLYKVLSECNNRKHNHENRNLKVAIALLDRLTYDTWYYDNAYRLHKKLYGERCMKIKNGKMYFYNEDVTDTKTQVKADKDAGRCSKLAHIHEKQDFEYLFDVLKKHIRNWWN